MEWQSGSWTARIRFLLAAGSSHRKQSPTSDEVIRDYTKKANREAWHILVSEIIGDSIPTRGPCFLGKLHIRSGFGDLPMPHMGDWHEQRATTLNTYFPCSCEQTPHLRTRFDCPSISSRQFTHQWCMESCLVILTAGRALRFGGTGQLCLESTEATSPYPQYSECGRPLNLLLFSSTSLPIR